MPLPRTIQQRRDFTLDERFAMSERYARRFGADDPATAFGAELRRQRRQRKLSSAHLATLAGLSTSAVCRLEKGNRDQPQRDTVLKLAEALAATPRDRDRLLVLARHLPAGRGVKKLVYERLGLEGEAA